MQFDDDTEEWEALRKSLDHSPLLRTLFAIFIVVVAILLVALALSQYHAN